jgi:nucleotide-binding universal stress UspA family protein
MRVLVPVEDPFYGEAIAEFIGRHQWHPGTIFKVISVIEPPYVGDQVSAIYGAGLYDAMLQDQSTNATNLVTKIKESLSKKLDPATPIETNVFIGNPIQDILHCAEQWKADQIVMGSHGRKGFDKFLIGSVSNAVLSHAGCSVVVVHLPNAAKDTAKEPAGVEHKQKAAARR